MNWRESTYEDLQRIDIPRDPAIDVRGMLEDTQKEHDAMKENARTLEKDGRVLAIVAVAPIWTGVGTVWTLLSNEARGHGVALSFGVTRFIDMLMQERGFWRLQATVEKGDEAGLKWILRLGFKYEGTFFRYGPDGKDHDTYARVK